MYLWIVPKSNIIIQDNNKLETCQARYVVKKMLEYLGLEMPEIALSENRKPFFKDSNIFLIIRILKNIYLALFLCQKLALI